MTDINVSLDTIRSIASAHEERLVAEGHHPAQAHRLAMARAGRELMRASKSSEVDELADRVHRGEATIVQLADKIDSDKRLGREHAFAEAERLLSERGARVAAVPLDPASVGPAQRVPSKGESAMTIVQLADKIQTEQKCDRDTAFAQAERVIRGR